MLQFYYTKDNVLDLHTKGAATLNNEWGSL